MPGEEDGRAFAAVPLGATDSVELQVLTGNEDVVENTVMWVPVTPRQAAGEKVQAAERFTPPPDSARCAGPLTGA